MGAVPTPDVGTTLPGGRSTFFEGMAAPAAPPVHPSMPAMAQPSLAVPQGYVAPVAVPPPSAPSAFQLPELPATSGEGLPEVCAVVKGGVLQYSRQWYGTEGERDAIHQIMADWAEENQADALIFFAATETFVRPKPKLQRLSKGGDSDE